MKTDVYLCFDFGMKRIGVAVGQSLTQTANPLPHLLAQEGIPNWEEIKKLINSWKPKALVVGIPLNMSGLDQEITVYARQFIESLKKKFHMEVYGVDERLTTKEARSQMFERGGFRALQKGKIDSMAAKLMLEDWMHHTLLDD